MLRNEIVMIVFGALYLISLVFSLFSAPIVGGATVIFGVIFSILYTKRISISNLSRKKKVFHSLLITFSLLILYLYLVLAFSPAGAEGGIYLGAIFLSFIGGAIALISDTIILVKNKNTYKGDFSAGILSVFIYVILVVIVLSSFYNPVVKNLSISSSNEGLCDLLISLPGSHEGTALLSKSDRFECITEIAIEKTDSSLCSKLCDGEDVSYYCGLFMSKCYGEIIRETGDFDLCIESYENGLSVPSVRACLKQFPNEAFDYYNSVPENSQFHKDFEIYYGGSGNNIQK